MEISIKFIWLYALSNEINEEIYVGISDNPDRRIIEHNKGKNRYTKAFMPWSPFYYARYNDYSNARVAEKYYKRSNNKKKLKVFLEKWRQTGEVTVVMN
jgi:putative endonuclease